MRANHEMADNNGNTFLKDIKPVTEEDYDEMMKSQASEMHQMSAIPMFMKKRI